MTTSVIQLKRLPKTPHIKGEIPLYHRSGEKPRVIPQPWNWKLPQKESLRPKEVANRRPRLCASRQPNRARHPLELIFFPLAFAWQKKKNSGPRAEFVALWAPVATTPRFILLQRLEVSKVATTKVATLQVHLKKCSAKFPTGRKQMETKSPFGGWQKKGGAVGVCVTKCTLRSTQTAICAFARWLTFPVLEQGRM